MKRRLAVFTLLLLIGSFKLSAETPPETYICVREQPYVDPYNPAAAICGTSCGLSVCSVAAAIAAVIGVAALILANGEHVHVH